MPVSWRAQHLAHLADLGARRVLLRFWLCGAARPFAFGFEGEAA
ncbi:MAG: hypothetical protein ACRDI2_06385 [Chloroflexota bacterium]